MGVADEGVFDAGKQLHHTFCAMDEVLGAGALVGDAHKQAAVPGCR